jgi:hypothetical protein
MPLLSTAGASAEFLKAVCAAGEGSESKHRAEARDPGCFSLRRPADRSGAGFYSGFGLCGRRGRVTRGLEAFSAPLPARGCSGTSKVDCRGKMISEASLGTRSRNNASQPIGRLGSGITILSNDSDITITTIFKSPVFFLSGNLLNHQS